VAAPTCIVACNKKANRCAAGARAADKRATHRPPPAEGR